MSRTTILSLLIFLTIITSASTQDNFLEGFGDFVDGIGRFVENIDLSFDSPDTSNSYNHRNSYHYHDDPFFNTYISIRVLESLFKSKHMVNDEFSSPPLTTIILKYSIAALSCIVLSLIIIFILLDIVKRRPIKGKRIYNMVILWIFGVITQVSLILIFMGLMIFWPYFLAVSLVLFLSYSLFWVYKRSGVRIVRHHID